MTDDNENDDDYGEWNSGPFCRHFSDPSDCETLCGTLGCDHRCCRHDADGECTEEGCVCTGWTDKNDKMEIVP